MERAVYDRMAEIDGEHWWFAGRRRIIANLIRRQVSLPSDARILEVGCGTGSNIRLLRQFGTVDAVEPDDSARAIASSRSGIAVKGGLLPDGVLLEDGAYDLIVLLDVLEHIPGDREALTALRSKLRLNGRILLTVPAMPWLWSAHDAAHHHHRRYTGSTLRGVLRDGGYRVRYLSYFNTILFPLIVLARGIGKLTGREDGDDAMPPAALNSVLEKLFSAESAWIGRFRLPVGVSLAVVAEPA